MPAVVVLTTVPNLKSGKLIARKLLEKKLAGCVSAGEGFVSSYWWKGKIETARETLLIIKTAKQNFERVREVIKQNHPYELPEVISLPIIQGSGEYLKWLSQSCDFKGL